MSATIFMYFLLSFSILTAHFEPSAISQEEALFEEIFQEHLQLLPHIHEPHPKLLVMFFGTPGMGKTSIAKKIEDHFHALRLSRDEAREILAGRGLWTGYGTKGEVILHCYFTWLLQKLSKCSPNQFIVLDCKCNRKYDDYVKFSQKYNYGIFLIRIVVEREIVEERIRSRGRTVEALLQDLDEEWQNYEHFGQEHRPDHIFYNGKDLESPLKSLLNHIHQKLDEFKVCLNFEFQEKTP